MFSFVPDDNPTARRNNFIISFCAGGLSAAAWWLHSAARHDTLATAWTGHLWLPLVLGTIGFLLMLITPSGGLSGSSMDDLEGGRRIVLLVGAALTAAAPIGSIWGGCVMQPVHNSAAWEYIAGGMFMAGGAFLFKFGRTLPTNFFI